MGAHGEVGRNLQAEGVTIISVRVQGHRTKSRAGLYSPLWVNRLHAAAHRWLAGPVQHISLTDAPSAAVDKRIQEIDIGKWWRRQGLNYGWWAKVALFHPGLVAKMKYRRVMFLDLDTLIIAPLQPVLDSVALAPIAFAPHTAPNFNPPGTVNRYSSACMVWTPGEAADLFTEWKPGIANRLRGDQDWFATKRPKEAKIPGAFFQRSSESIREGRPREGVAIIFCAKVKNDEAAKQSDYFKQHWSDSWESALSP